MLPPRIYGGSGTRPKRSKSTSVGSSASAWASHCPSSSRSISHSFTFSRPSRSRREIASPAFNRPRVLHSIRQCPSGVDSMIQPLPTTARLGSDAGQLGADHLRIVENQPVSGGEQVRANRVRDGARSSAGGDRPPSAGRRPGGEAAPGRPADGEPRNRREMRRPAWKSVLTVSEWSSWESCPRRGVW